MSYRDVVQSLIIPEKDHSLWFKLRMRWYDSWIYKLYQYSWAYDLRWYITHWWRKDHWVKTNLPIGYHDKVQLMEDALFSLVENYVSSDQENAFSVVSYDWCDENIEVKKKIFKILHFYRIDKPEMEKQYNDLLHLCFGPCESTFTPCNDGSEHLIWNMNYTGPMTEEEREEKIKEMHNLEQQIYLETQEMLKLCVEIRPYLWS